VTARNRRQRHADDLTVARVLDHNLDAALDLADKVAHELGDSGCHRILADARVAAELAERIDAILVLPEPLETLDRPVLFLVALAALAIRRVVRDRLLDGEDQRALARRLSARHLAAAADPERLAAE
jgi:hypothetical protein